MEGFPQSFAGKALSALHELVPEGALASILHQTTYMQWPSSQSYLPDITNILQDIAAWCFPRQGSPWPAKIIKHFLPCLHPDRQQMEDFRLQYVSMTLTAFLTQCQKLIHGEQPDNNICTRPPSGPELDATRLAAQADRNGAHAQHLRNNEERGTRPVIKSAECELWVCILQNIKHIPLGGCFRLGCWGWSAVYILEGVHIAPGFTEDEQGSSHDDNPSQGDDDMEDNNQTSAGDSPRNDDDKKESMDDINDDILLLNQMAQRKMMTSHWMILVYPKDMPVPQM
eukprot:15367214-Ditylum_brightwellii.AAC.4